MYPKVPAPSKGALRALRHLALGTTCTIAFSTAVITEDRRRRIRAAHVANENGRKIKSLSRYHSSNTAASADFEDDVIRYGYFDPVPNNRTPRVLEVRWSDSCLVENKNEDVLRRKNSHSNDAGHSLDEERETHQDQVDEQYEALKSRSQPSGQPQTRAVTNGGQPKIRYRLKRKPVAPDRASRDLLGLFDKGEATVGIWAQRADSMVKSLDVNDVRVVDSVAQTFLDLFQSDWEGRSLGNPMIELAQKLINACIHHQRMDTATEILRHLCRSTVMDEETFMLLHPETILDYLISKPGFQSKETDGGAPFKQAIALFCPLLKKKPEQRYPNMATIGQRICEAAFQMKLYDLFDKIYWRAQAWCPGNTAISIEMLIKAQQKMANHKKVVDYFIRLFPKTDPKPNQLFEMATLALDSSMSMGNLPKSEASLQVAADVSSNQGYNLPTALLFRVLREHWRVKRDFASLQELFERLEKHVDIIHTPTRLYALMIEMCIKADHPNDIQRYVDRAALQKSSTTSDLWIRGQIAVGKAAMNDWTGVEDEFKATSKQLYELGSISQHRMIMSSSFTPILKLFIKHHDITETEEFLRRCIDYYGVVLNQNVNNIMIGVYTKADDLDSIPEWLKYARSKGLSLDATSFNLLLQDLKKRSRLPYSKLHPLYVRIKAIDESLVNEVTLRLLGSSAIDTYCVKPEIGTPSIAKTALKAPSDSHSVKYAMNVALSKGEFRKVLEIYGDAKHKKIWLPNSVLDLAMDAIRQIGGDGAADDITDLLADAQHDGRDITHTLTRFLVYELRDANMQGRDVDNLFRLTDMNLTRHGLSIPLQAVTEAIAILVQRGKFRQALDLWSSVYRRPSGELHPVDLPILTVLLKAYVGLFDCNGIRWVVKTLIANEIKSDATFRKVLKEAAKSVKRKLAVPPRMEYLKVMSTVLKECLQDIHERSVVPALERRKEAQKKVLEIMMSAGAQVQAEQSAEQLDTTKKDGLGKILAQKTGKAEKAE